MLKIAEGWLSQLPKTEIPKRKSHSWRGFLMFRSIWGLCSTPFVTLVFLPIELHHVWEELFVEWFCGMFHMSHGPWLFASIQPIIVRLKTGSADTNRLSSWKGSQIEVRRCMNIMMILWLFVTFVCTFSHLPEKTLTKPMRNTVIIRWIQSVPKACRGCSGLRWHAAQQVLWIRSRVRWIEYWTHVFANFLYTNSHTQLPGTLAQECMNTCQEFLQKSYPHWMYRSSHPVLLLTPTGGSLCQPRYGKCKPIHSCSSIEPGAPYDTRICCQSRSPRSKCRNMKSHELLSESRWMKENTWNHVPRIYWPSTSELKRAQTSWDFKGSIKSIQVSLKWTILSMIIKICENLSVLATFTLNLLLDTIL